MATDLTFGEFGSVKKWNMSGYFQMVALNYWLDINENIIMYLFLTFRIGSSLL